MKVKRPMYTYVYGHACMRACVRAYVRVCARVTTKVGARAHANHESVCANGSAWSESQDRFTPFTKSTSPLSRKNEKEDILLSIRLKSFGKNPS